MNISAQKILEKKFSKSSGSYWLETSSFPASEELHENVKADVAVVGGGITGLTAAYLLARAGKNVAVLESKPLGEGDTGHTSAHLTSAVDPRYAIIEKYHGADAARQVFRNQVMTINWIESFALKEKIDCDFHRVNGYLFLGEGQKLSRLEEEWRALNTAGCSDAIWLQDIGVEAFRGKPAIRIHGQARFHPLKYLAGLAAAFQSQGGRIYTGAAAQKIHNGEIVTARGFKVNAEKIIIATHSPIAGTFIFLKQAAYRSYVIGARIPKDSFPDALFWDTSDPYHYIRVEPRETFDLLIVGGEDRKTGESTADEEPFEKLEEWTRRKFKHIIQSVDYYWSGQVLEAADGLPYIGMIPYRDHSLYMATGFSGNGLTYGTLAGHILRDLILGVRNPAVALYKPVRKNIFSWREFLRENFDALKKLFLGWTSRETMDLEKLRPEQGAVVSRGIKKMAVYRSAAGRLIKVSAVCPHLGCVVQWNQEEKTFDCPCHGSRFDCEGKVMQGPAHKDLTPLK